MSHTYNRGGIAMLIGLHGVKQVPNGTPGSITCGHCDRSWLEDIAPSARCPFEYEHEYEDD